ncbi:MAG: Magnesium transporter MgtE [Phycisphaerae bacterium]|nr:Magnesium transporter MgtE [Phycisphaerae bacterium]
MTTPEPTPPPHPDEVADAIESLQHPADAADAIESLPAEQRAEVLDELPPQTAAELLEQMDDRDSREIVQEMQPSAATEAVAHMAPDDAADILAGLESQTRTQILQALPSAERQALEGLMSYPPESAGGVMSPRVTALSADMTIEQAIAELRRLADTSEQIYYTYVVDAGGRLVGVLSLRDLLLGQARQRLADIMLPNVRAVRAEVDREEVAALLTKYGYYALPVVDADQRLLGIVTVDDVVDIIQDEATEDMQRMVGAGGDERVDSPVALSLRRRVPWLQVNLATAFLAAWVVSLFEGTIQTHAVLAVLMPIVAGQAGNTGAQAMAIMIRGIATGEARGLRLRRLILRETLIGLGSGLTVGVTSGLATWCWFGNASAAAAIALSMLLAMLIAAAAGALVPWLMQRLGFDPAQSSSIILTTVTDVAGFGLFLALGAWMLSSVAT